MDNKLTMISLVDRGKTVNLQFAGDDFIYDFPQWKIAGLIAEHIISIGLADRKMLANDIDAYLFSISSIGLREKDPRIIGVQFDHFIEIYQVNNKSIADLIRKTLIDINIDGRITMIRSSGKDIIFRLDGGELHSVSHKDLFRILDMHVKDKSSAHPIPFEYPQDPVESDLMKKHYGTLDDIKDMQDQMSAYITKKDLIQRIKNLRAEGIKIAFHTSGNGLASSTVSNYRDRILSPGCTWEAIEKVVQSLEKSRGPFQHLKKLGLIDEV